MIKDREGQNRTNRIGVSHLVECNKVTRSRYQTYLVGSKSLLKNGVAG